VRCARCGRYAGYNAPRTETGRPRRSLRSRPQLSPSQRSRILERDNSTCLKCGGDGPLNVAHWISVQDGKAVGLSEAELFDDENLLVLCAECNVGRVAKPYRCSLWQQYCVCALPVASEPQPRPNDAPFGMSSKIPSDLREAGF
jgi:5-methylcytosine-specific restriction endonuclease McrA